jgi:hypothetical protein
MSDTWNNYTLEILKNLLERYTSLRRFIREGVSDFARSVPRQDWIVFGVVQIFRDPIN